MLARRPRPRVLGLQLETRSTSRHGAASSREVLAVMVRRSVGRHMDAAEATVARAWSEGVNVPETLTASLFGLAEAWDAIEEARGPYSTLPNIAREIRVLTDRLVATTHPLPGADPWDELEREANRSR